MKEKIIAIVILSMFTVPVLAQNISSEHFSQQVFSSQNTHQVAELSHSEMKDTKGRFGPWDAALGGFSGGLSYVTEHEITNKPMSWSGFLGDTGEGAAIGFFAPPGVEEMSLAGKAIWAFNTGVGTGIINAARNH